MFIQLVNFESTKESEPVMVAEWSGRELCTLARMLGSCVRIPLQAWIFSVVCVFLCLCTCRDLATSCSHAQVVMPTVLDLVSEVERKVSWGQQRPELGCRSKGEKKTVQTSALLSTLVNF